VIRLYDIIMKTFNVFACLCSKLSYGPMIVIEGEWFFEEPISLSV